MDESFYQNYSAKLHENVCLSPNNECMLWSGCTKGKLVKYGVINCRFRCGYNRAVTVHRLSYMLQHRITHVDSGLDASHLCHNSLCVKVSHISMEPHSVNNNRQYCMAQNFCFGHGQYSQCMLELKYKKW